MFSTPESKAHQAVAGLITAVEALETFGFEVEEVSVLLNNPADDHTLAIRDPSLGRNTDRFLIKARKPK